MTLQLTAATNSKIARNSYKFRLQIYLYGEHILTFWCWENVIHSVSYNSTMQNHKPLMWNITGSQITCFRTSTFKQCILTINTKNSLLIENVKYHCLMKTEFWLRSPCLKNIESTSVAFSLIWSILHFSHGNGKIFSCRGIEIAIEYFRKRGHEQITVFVPKLRTNKPRPQYPIQDQKLLNKLEDEGYLKFTPSRRMKSYDDRWVCFGWLLF